MKKKRLRLLTIKPRQRNKMIVGYKKKSYGNKIRILKRLSK